MHIKRILSCKCWFICKLVVVLLLFGVAFVFFYEDLLDGYCFVSYYFSPQYTKDRALVKPYFDEDFYRKHYATSLKKSYLKPLDHFLIKGWCSNNWRKHTDPNSWFNTTLYLERLWHVSHKVHPFVDFLRQPKSCKHLHNIDVWMKKEEIRRVWLAVEGLLRLNKFNVVLHIASDVKQEELECFKPQLQRGLKISYDNREKISFYHSAFIRDPMKYGLTNLQPKVIAPVYNSMTYVKQDFAYIEHHPFVSAWRVEGKINPTFINIGYACDEPLQYAPFLGDYMHRLHIILRGFLQGGKSKIRQLRALEYKDYLMRVAEGFDLYILNFKLPIHNLRIIPGHMSCWVDEKELNPKKEFSVSFLLTSKDDKLASGVWNYNLRRNVWSKEKEFKIPLRFYLSYRNRQFFPKDMQDRVMPTYSKKWIFNSAFNIAIENVNQQDYFTEKLLNCFMALTVPIYIGCPNIFDYFDVRGMLVVKSVDELIQVVNSLTPQIYKQMLPYLKENKKRALKLLKRKEEIFTEFGKKLY